jgi:hypothetical protein
MSFHTPMIAETIATAIGQAKLAEDSSHQLSDVLVNAQRAGQIDKGMIEQINVLLDRFQNASDNLVLTLLDLTSEPEPAIAKKLAAFEIEDDDTNLPATGFTPPDQKQSKPTSSQSAK